MIRALKYILFSTAVITLSGCLATRQDIREGVKSEPPTQEQQVNASNEVRYQELETQTRQLIGRVETLENSINMLSAEKTGSHAEQTAAKKTTDEKLKILEEAVTKLESENAALLAKVEALRVAHSAGEAAVKAAKSDNKKNTLEQAEVEFQKHSWKESIISYQKYRDANPTGKKYPEATYKIGAAFHELGMKSDAKAFYTEVAEKFPKSDWAKKASAKLKILK